MMFEQAVYGKAYSQSATPGERFNGAEPDGEDTGICPRLNGASTEVMDTMAGCIKNRSCQYDRLEEALNR